MWWRVLSLVIVYAILLHAWVQAPSGSAIVADANQNLRLAYNLANYGVFSSQREPSEATPLPTNYREPLPPIGKLLGFNEDDLKLGGRLQRLNRSRRSDFHKENMAAEDAGRPEDTFTYYSEARAER